MEMEAPSDWLLKLTYCEDGSLRFSFHPTKNLFRPFQSVWQFTKSETSEKGINVGSANASSKFEYNETSNGYL